MWWKIELFGYAYEIQGTISQESNSLLVGTRENDFHIPSFSVHSTNGISYNTRYSTNDMCMVFLSRVVDKQGFNDPPIIFIVISEE